MSVRNRVLAHRGLWFDQGVSGNSMEAMVNALRNDYGLETDIRDFHGQVIVEHDPAVNDSDKVRLNRLFGTVRDHASPDQLIALNVKSDGLLSLIEAEGFPESISNNNVFFFDMSIPETIRFSKARLPFAQRLSEYETPDSVDSIKWPTQPSAYWVDGFHSDWFLDKSGSLLKRLSEKIPVVVVSSELHGRDNSNLADWFLENLIELPKIYVCTDKPGDYAIG